jgi:hypothetical protein
MRPDLPDPIEATALFDVMWSMVLDQWKVHFLVVVPAQVAIELFTEAYRSAFPGDDALAPYALLDGLPNESTEADRELWRLAQRAKSMTSSGSSRRRTSSTAWNRRTTAVPSDASCPCTWPDSVDGRAGTRSRFPGRWSDRP